MSADTSRVSGIDCGRQLDVAGGQFARQKTLQPGKDAAHRHDIDLHDHALGDAPVVLHEMQQPFAAPGHGFQRFLGIGQFGPRGIIGRQARP